MLVVDLIREVIYSHFYASLLMSVLRSIPLIPKDTNHSLYFHPGACHPQPRFQTSTMGFQTSAMAYPDQLSSEDEVVELCLPLEAHLDGIRYRQNLWIKFGKHVSKDEAYA